MIDFQNVSFSYGKKQIFEHMRFHIEKGEHVCFFGPSGIGKTTLIRLLLGFLKPTDGQVEVRAQKIATVFQEDRLIPFVTVRKNVSRFSDDGVADELLDRVELTDVKDVYPGSLSGGMKRRVALARALSYDADMLVLDEPFTALDTDLAARMVNLVNEKAEGKTLVLITHSMDEAEKLGCRIINMCDFCVN